MARADLLLALVRAALSGDLQASRTVIEAITAEEQHKRHTVLARQLASELSSARHQHSRDLSRSSTPSRPDVNGLQEYMPKRRLSDIHLPDNVRKQIDRLLEEHNRSDLLRNYSLEPRHKILLTGPPGNGKTSTAEAIATELAAPFLILKYEEVITSYLGETAERLEGVLSEARKRHCVLFLDEFDVIGKERSDEHETGEIKRIVSGLLLQLDRLPSHVVLIAATNHSHLLDSAAWRRFEIQLDLPQPSDQARGEFVTQLAADTHLGASAANLKFLLSKAGNVSFAELEYLVMYVRRREVLSGSAWNQAEAKKAITEAAESRLSHTRSV